ncbi:uncharacterized protein LOC116951891 isoform X3 [Petromyzon marinus]|uniref:uncharacterized protein LOC116951891 isoform X3 n=1 Tax=Petromyzon marinus TaxID=7757 RepID=UPI003F71FDA2
MFGQHHLRCLGAFFYCCGRKLKNPEESHAKRRELHAERYPDCIPAGTAMIQRGLPGGRGWPGADLSDASFSDESTGLPFRTTRLAVERGVPGPRGSVGNGLGMVGPMFTPQWVPSPLPGHASPTATRFLKKKPQTDVHVGASVARTSASSAAALQRLSRFEEKLKARVTGPTATPGARRQPSASPSPGAPPTVELAVSMPGDELSGNGSRFLKKKKTTMMMTSTPAESLGNTEPPRPTASAAPREDALCNRDTARTGGSGARTLTPVGAVDSDEEEMRRLLGSSFESHDSERKHARSPQTPTNRNRFLKMREATSTEPPGGSAPRLPPSPPEMGRAKRSPVHEDRTARSPSVMRRGAVKRSPSPASIRSEVNSDDERFSDASVAPSRRDDVSSASASDDFKMNLMTVDDLLPALPVSDPPPIKRGHERSAFSSDVRQPKAHHLSDKPSAGTTRNLRTPSPRTRMSSENSSIEKSSEIATMSEVSDVSERLEVASIRDGGDHSSASSLSHGRIGSRGGKPSRSVSPVDSDSAASNYSEDFEEDDDSCDADARRPSHSGDSSPRSESPASGSSSLRPRGRRESSRLRTRGLTDSVRRDVKRRGRNAAVQTVPGLNYAWVQDAALTAEHAGKYAAPMPIASHFISGETLEALTTYRPSTLALEELLRGQLELTREFVSRCQGLHASLVEALAQERYPYTTLAETRQFLERNRRPKLTMEEAQEQVLREMREYHYL